MVDAERDVTVTMCLIGSHPRHDGQRSAIMRGLAGGSGGLSQAQHAPGSVIVIVVTSGQGRVRGGELVSVAGQKGGYVADPGGDGLVPGAVRGPASSRQRSQNGCAAITVTCGSKSSSIT